MFTTAGDLVHGLAVSSDKESNSEAIKKADDYLEREAKAIGQCTVSGQDRTVINRGPPPDRTEHAQSGSEAAASSTDMGIYIYTVVHVLTVSSVSLLSSKSRC